MKDDEEAAFAVAAILNKALRRLIYELRKTDEWEDVVPESVKGDTSYALRRFEALAERERKDDE